uniref:PROP1-like PPR domain-containing protein n=1 Tax=Oryza nivara TaxID=4536 RepID=A0A0E0GSE3_ORYNI
MSPAVRTKRPPPQPLPRRPPPPKPSAESKPAKARAPATSLLESLKSFKSRLAAGPPLAPTPKSFKSYAETCASILRLCSAAAAASGTAAASSNLPLVLSIHAHALVSGLTADGSVASHLLTAYAAFARAADRDGAFRDCVSVVGAASPFAYDFMVREHVKAGDIVSARRLFDGMPERSVVSYTTMVDALMKRGSVRDAVELYRQCPLCSVPFFTAMIAGFVLNELPKDALGVFHEMLSCGVSPNEITLVSVIKACIGAGEFDLAMSIVGLAMKSNLLDKNLGVRNSLITLYLRKGDADAARRMFDEMEVRDVVSWTALLDVYAELGDLEGARRVLDEMPERNEVSWGTLVARHEQKGNAKEAVSLYSQMLADGCRPNISCFSSVLGACASLQDLRSGRKIHNQTLKMACSNNVFVSSALIDMYCKCKQLPDAQMIFYSLPQKNIVCWNSLISGYSNNSKMVEAEELFKKMPARNVASWNSIISGYAQNRQFIDALKSFHAMLASGQSPGEITFSSVLLACASLCSLEMGKMVHAKIIKLGIKESIFVGTALSDMYAKSGDLDSSKRVFYEMPKRNDVAWTAMIQGLAENGFAEESILLFEDMISAGITPNEQTFLAILFACSHSGLVEHAMHYFEMMQACGISPKAKHYTCMVDVLARAGHLAEAEDLLLKIESKSEANSWAALLSACNIYRNKEMGERAAKRLQELDKDNTAGYVLLSNMYASCGKWKDAAEMRILMKGINLKKDGGCSWVQIRDYCKRCPGCENPKHELCYELALVITFEYELSGVTVEVGKECLSFRYSSLIENQYSQPDLRSCSVEKSQKCTVYAVSATCIWIDWGTDSSLPVEDASLGKVQILRFLCCAFHYQSQGNWTTCALHSKPITSTCSRLNRGVQIGWPVPVAIDRSASTGRPEPRHLSGWAVHIRVYYYAYSSFPTRNHRSNRVALSSGVSLQVAGAAGMEPLEVAITIIFDALLLVFMVKLFFAMFQMKLVVILFYLVILLFAMAFSGRAPSSF